MTIDFVSLMEEELKEQKKYLEHFFKMRLFYERFTEMPQYFDCEFCHKPHTLRFEAKGYVLYACNDHEKKARSELRKDGINHFRVMKAKENREFDCIGGSLIDLEGKAVGKCKECEGVGCF